MTMSVHELLMGVFAVAVILAIPLVAGRLVWCAIRAVRAHHYRVAIQAGAGVAFFVILILGMLAWWFILGVSHRQKDITDGYWAMAATGIPYFLAALGLWHFAGALGSRLESGATERSIPAQELAAARGPVRVAAALLAVVAFALAAALLVVILFFPLMLMAGPSSRMLPLPLAVLVWLAAVGLVILGPAWLARLVYRRLSGHRPV
jgi:hypothetical protein